jgi:hypothetical protein
MKRSANDVVRSSQALRHCCEAIVEGLRNGDIEEDTGRVLDDLCFTQLQALSLEACLLDLGPVPRTGARIEEVY